jgi:class 3 adenylate cyclase/tetratricopeptide (TPR) repeat protein
VDVAVWLRGLGLEHYEPAFRDNRIDAEVLPKLTVDDLKDIGVAAVGDRRKLLDAIAALRKGALPSPTTEQPAEAPAPATAAPATAERRQLTVMFCDLVGSTALSARLDPEELREVIGAYHGAVAQAAAGFDGFVAKYMGDGVLVYFGYPRAHEDDAERAVRAGLGILDAVRGIEVKTAALAARVGIATGLVVVGDLIGAGAAQEQSVVGETPNLAARLQALAEPDTVVIAASTRRLVAGLFEYSDLGAVAVKGLAVPVPAWRVLRPSAVASRFEALRGAVLSQLVGRDEEIELLSRRWARAKAGDGQAVLVVGDPGIGKSRLVAALAERLQTEKHIRLRHFCSSYHQDSALYPFIEQLARASGFVRDDPPAARREKLEALLARATPPDEDPALLADLLSLPPSEYRPLPHLSAQRKKERTLDALIRQLEGLSRQQPVLMLFEDAHWIDPTSRELLDLIVERLGKLPVLLVLTFRPEFQPPWSGQPQVSILALNRLGRHDRTALVARVAGGKALPAEVLAEIAERTDGVPLFIEELTKSVLESGLLREETDRYVLDQALPPLSIPASLHDSLMARLDRSPSVRRVAQIGAAIGRQFSYRLLRAVCRLPEDELLAAVDRLVAAELVFQRGTRPDAVYAFKHALVQDAAHGSLLRSGRRQLHAEIAAALEAHSPELLDSQPELLAQHYAEAGLVEKSVACWGKAGHGSVARSAMAEAAAQFQKALDQLALLRESPERQRRELEFYSALGAVLYAVKGTAAKETGHAYTRARELWEGLGSPSEFLEVPYGQSIYYTLRGEFETARRLQEDLLRLSRERNDAAGLILGHASRGRTLMFAGRFAQSMSHLEAALSLYDPTSHRWLVHQTAAHPEAASRAISAITLFCLGYPEQALARSSAAIAEVRKLAHLPSMAVTLGWGAQLLLLVGGEASPDEWIDQLMAIATEQGFPLWRAGAMIYRGEAKVKNGALAEGIALMRRGSTAYRATGSEVGGPLSVAAPLAAAYEAAGRAEEALAVLDDALQIVDRTGERWLLAELYRDKGELLRQRHPEAAEELYRQALGIAREQKAKLWELRAAASLARLWGEQGRRAEARELLAPVYGWFTEGFGTPVLQEAKALLQELPA